LDRFILSRSLFLFILLLLILFILSLIQLLRFILWLRCVLGLLIVLRILFLFRIGRFVDDLNLWSWCLYLSWYCHILLDLLNLLLVFSSVIYILLWFGLWFNNWGINSCFNIIFCLLNWLFNFGYLIVCFDNHHFKILEAFWNLLTFGYFIDLTRCLWPKLSISTFALYLFILFFLYESQQIMNIV
jgi:hypothetical protein